MPGSSEEGIADFHAQPGLVGDRVVAVFELITFRDQCRAPEPVVFGRGDVLLRLCQVQAHQEADLRSPVVRHGHGAVRLSHRRQLPAIQDAARADVELHDVEESLRLDVGSEFRRAPHALTVGNRRLDPCLAHAATQFAIPVAVLRKDLLEPVQPLRLRRLEQAPRPVVFHFVSTKFFRLFRCKAEEFFGLIHYCRKELQWRA